LSDYASEEDKRRSLQFGFDQHLAKPATYKDIEALLATP
jgi:CheY-like chemotaxis protein